MVNYHTLLNEPVLTQNREPLQHLAGSVMKKLLPDAVQNKNFFINDIPSNLAVEYNQDRIIAVLEGLLRTVLYHSRETCIRLSARQYGYVVVLELKESGSINDYAMACGLQEVNSLAEMIGGCLSISVQKPMTTVAFSFPNLPMAA
jgi:hypothetical protein